MYNKTTRQNKNKRIAFLIPSLSTGGMERVMSEVANYIAINTQTDCHLILYGKSREIFYEISQDIKVYRPSFEFDDKRRQWMTVKTMKFIRSTIRAIKPDSALSFGEMWNSLVLLSLIGIKSPIYISDRSAPNVSHGRFQDYLRKALYPRAAGVIAQTYKAKELFKEQFYNKNVTVIGNPIRQIKDVNSIQREKIVVSVGRLITSKNFNRLIDIFHSVENKDWKLIIIGGDSNKQTNSLELKQQINKLNLNDRVILAGTQKNVEKYLLKASIFAFTSSSEGFPNVIGEAMSAGLPVIAYDCISGPSDMIENGKNGYLVPLFDDERFKNNLQYLIDHKIERELMGVYAKESIIRFSSEKICEQFYTFLSSK